MAKKITRDLWFICKIINFVKIFFMKKIIILFSFMFAALFVQAQVSVSWSNDVSSYFVPDNGGQNRYIFAYKDVLLSVYNDTYRLGDMIQLYRDECTNAIYLSFKDKTMKFLNERLVETFKEPYVCQ